MKAASHRDRPFSCKKCGNLKIAALAAAILCFTQPLAYAQSAPDSAGVQAFDIPAQPLATALREFARQSGQELLFSPDVAAEKTTGGIKGTLPPLEALSALLQNTGISFSTTSNGAILLRNNDAQATQGARTPTGLTTSVPSVPASVPNASGPVQASAGESGLDSDLTKIIELEEVVVTGSRLSGDLRPVGTLQVFDRQKIDELGITTVPDILRYVPQVPFSFVERFDAPASGQVVQLRGLPVGKTLTLINGRRTGGSEIGASFDLNLISLAAVERVEVLTDSASAVYGADAVGGVVNIITKRSVDRPVLDLRYGSADGDATEWQSSLTGGYIGEKFRVVGLVDYRTRNPLFGAQRDRWANQDYRRFGSVDRRIANANPAAIVSTTAANLPGLTSRFALVNSGSSGMGLSAADFTAVPTEADLATESFRRFANIVFDREQVATAGFAELELTSAVKLFADAYYTDGTFKYQDSPSLGTFTVPSDNPFNPFGVPVSARYLFEGVGPRKTRFDYDMYSISAGATATFGSWSGELVYHRAESNRLSTFRENNVDIAQANCLLTNPATRAAGACKGITEVLNVFQDGPGGGADLLESLRLPPPLNLEEVDGNQVTGFTRGPIFSVPAGAVEAVVGGSWSDERVKSSSIAGERNSTAAFAEMNIPLVASTMKIPAVRSLSFRAAVRYDHYSDFGDTVNPQYTLLWDPVRDLRLSATYSTSFAPPTLLQLVQPRSSFAGIVIPDAARNNEQVPVLFTSGGNPNLTPEKGESYSFGFQWNPSWQPDLVVSATYWSIDLSDRVLTPNFRDILLFPSDFPGRSTRAAPTAADMAQGLPGMLLSVDNSLVNASFLRTSGIDWSISYAVETQWGRFSPSLSATWIEQYFTKDFPTKPAQDLVGIQNFAGTIPELKATASLGWTKGGVGINSSFRYTHSYEDSNLVANAIVPNGNKISSQVLVDIQASLDVGETMPHFAAVEALRISFGVRNLFEKTPPFVNAGGGPGYDQTLGDLVGRTVYVTLSKRF